MQTFFKSDPHLIEWIDDVIEKTITICIMAGHDCSSEFQKAKSNLEKIVQALRETTEFTPLNLRSATIQLLEQRYPDRRLIEHVPGFYNRINQLVEEILIEQESINEPEKSDVILKDENNENKGNFTPDFTPLTDPLNQEIFTTSIIGMASPSTAEISETPLLDTSKMDISQLNYVIPLSALNTANGLEVPVNEIKHAVANKQPADVPGIESNITTNVAVPVKITQTGTEIDVQSLNKSEVKTKTENEADNKTANELKEKPKPAVKNDSKSKAKTQHNAKAKAKAKGKAKLKPKPEVKPKPKPVVKPESELNSIKESKIKSENIDEPKLIGVKKAESISVSKPEPISESKAEPISVSKPEPIGESKAEPVISISEPEPISDNKANVLTDFGGIPKSKILRELINKPISRPAVNKLVYETAEHSQENLNAKIPTTAKIDSASLKIARTNHVPDRGKRLFFVLKELFPQSSMQWNFNIAGFEALVKVNDLLLFVDQNPLEIERKLKGQGWHIAFCSEEDLLYPRRLERYIRQALRRSKS